MHVRIWKYGSLKVTHIFDISLQITVTAKPRQLLCFWGAKCYDISHAFTSVVDMRYEQEAA